MELELERMELRRTGGRGSDRHDALRELMERGTSADGWPRICACGSLARQLCAREDDAGTSEGHLDSHELVLQGTVHLGKVWTRTNEE